MDKLNYCIKTDGSLVLLSKVLRPIAYEIGVSTATVRRWLKSPEIALKHGYFVGSVAVLKSKQGKGNAPLHQHRHAQTEMRQPAAP
jgi:hypothetical protein